MSAYKWFAVFLAPFAFTGLLSPLFEAIGVHWAIAGSIVAVLTFGAIGAKAIYDIQEAAP